MVLFACASCILGWSSMPAVALDALRRRGHDMPLTRLMRLVITAICVCGAILAWMLVKDAVACVAFSLSCACMGALLACDLRERILPTELVAMMLVLSIVFRIAAGTTGELVAIGTPAACVAGSMLVINEIRMRNGKPELIGCGDVRMIVPLTLFSGIQGIMHGIFAASLTMGVCAVIALVAGKSHLGAHTALAPALAAWLFAGTLIPLA